jgi:hypothetical protein
VAFRHRGVHLGYAPKRHHWVAPALDDGRRLVRYRRQDQSWRSLSPTRKVRARSNCRP